MVHLQLIGQTSKIPTRTTARLCDSRMLSYATVTILAKGEYWHLIT